jgi:ZIP zinc/iron transport family
MDAPPPARSWDDVPTAVLQAQLARRQETALPSCGSSKAGSYNTTIHVLALLLILLLSVAGSYGPSRTQMANRDQACAFPIAAKRFPRFPVPHQFLFLSRHFGTGVLIATAFVHLFPTAYISLTAPCLPPFWNKGYPAMAGLIAMMSVFLVVGIEMFFAMKGAGHVHGSGFDTMVLEGGEGHLHGQGRSTNGAAGPGKPGPSSSQADDSWDDDLDLDDFDPDSSSNLLHSTPKKATEEPPTRPEPKALLQCLLLEAGILFHSIFIGMALSVTPAPGFYVLLVAISFHQTFEGLALGSRISALTFSPRSPHPWLMALAYGTTTPLGQAIGLAIHSAYDPASQTGLLSVGIMNAISTGLLVFAGLVELLAADFLSEESYEQMRGRRRWHACAAVVSGALLMALVGAWA